MSRLNSVALFLLISSCMFLYLEALTCPSGQTLYQQRCYKTYRPSSKCHRDFSFDAANAFCTANNGTLVSIHNQAQNDFITTLIRKDQKNLQKPCGCASGTVKDYFYWIGLQLDRSSNQNVNGSSWTDKSSVDYGNPLGSSFRPPFAAGRPEGSLGDDGDDSAVCPDGNQRRCVQIYGFGPTKGLWTDKRCNDTHTIERKCSCNEVETNNNSTKTNTQTKNNDNSSANDFPQPDDCRDEAALNGFVCQFCPDGFVYFEGSCYKAVAGAFNVAQATAACTSLNSTVVSIHSAGENAFVSNLAVKSIPGFITRDYILIGLQLTHTSNAINAPVNSAAWSDGTPVNYGNPMVAPWTTIGTFPWSPAFGVYPAQPDNIPPPANCVLQWLTTNPSNVIGTWDDLACTAVAAVGTVCKI